MIVARPNDDQQLLYTYPAEIVIKTASDGKFKFPDNNILRGKQLYGLFIMRNDSGKVKAASGRDMISNDAIDAAYLTLEQDSLRVINQTPLGFFAVTAGDREFKQIFFKGFDPSTSFIEIVDTSTISDGQAIQVTFIYQDRSI